MKNVISIVAILTAPFGAIAQTSIPTSQNINIDQEVFKISSTIFTVALFMFFILAILKRVFENRLKNKIVDKGIPEDIASSILKSKTNEDVNINIKWFSILAGIGIGLTITNYTLPLGIHSLAIMSFCIAASFLGYYFFTTRK